MGIAKGSADTYVRGDKAKGERMRGVQLAFRSGTVRAGTARRLFASGSFPGTAGGEGPMLAVCARECFVAMALTVLAHELGRALAVRLGSGRREPMELGAGGRAGFALSRVCVLHHG